MLATCCHLLKPNVTFIINLFITRHFTELKAKEKGAKALFTFLPFFLFTFIINLFITRHFAELKAKEKGAKALFTFLPFYLFTFINSLAACLQSSAAASLPALPAAHAYTR